MLTACNTVVLQIADMVKAGLFRMRRATCPMLQHVATGCRCFRIEVLRYKCNRSIPFLVAGRHALVPPLDLPTDAISCSISARGETDAPWTLLSQRQSHPELAQLQATAGLQLHFNLCCLPLQVQAR